MFKRLIKKDKFLRKQYNRFEIWNKLNKSLDKSINLYNISEPFLLKKNLKNIAKRQFEIIVSRQEEAMVLYHFLESQEC